MTSTVNQVIILSSPRHRYWPKIANFYSTCT